MKRLIRKWLGLKDTHTTYALKIERLTKAEKTARLKEELADFSVFMPLFEYRDLKDVKVKVV